MSERHHTQLSLADRIAIQKGIESGRSFNSIANEIGKDRATVSREVKRNRTRHAGNHVRCIAELYAGSWISRHMYATAAGKEGNAAWTDISIILSLRTRNTGRR